MSRDGSAVPPIRTASGEPYAARAALRGLRALPAGEAWRHQRASGGGGGAGASPGGEAAEEAWRRGGVGAEATAPLGAEAAEGLGGGGLGLGHAAGASDEAIDEEELEAILDGARIQSGGLSALPWLHQL
ncbi:unnamed protein product [Prorocentrum cordatum]|uniref:Uncharacterized protein n=1 Tax=Prorocentrum cordatum TaxID=2364126 RepID=A0ABN9WAV3_9DINO|nr:unnamed protein product [Polarella glacialis]